MGKTRIQGTAIKKSGGEKVFEVVVYAIATLFCIYCLFPFAIILGSSFETEANFAVYGFPIIPKDFTIQAYQVVLGDAQIFRAYGVTIFTTVAERDSRGNSQDSRAERKTAVIASRTNSVGGMSSVSA